MKALIPFSIPVSGLRNGLHAYDFRVDDAFFGAFAESPVQSGDLSVHLDFDKRPGMYVMSFFLSGTVKTPCDRCLETIDLPVAGDYRLVVKFSEEERIDEAEVVYVSPNLEVLNVAQYVYEFIILSLPLIKVYNCEEDAEAVCNSDTLAYLEEADSSEEPADQEEDTIWDELKRQLNK